MPPRVAGGCALPSQPPRARGSPSNPENTWWPPGAAAMASTIAQMEQWEPVIALSQLVAAGLAMCHDRLAHRETVQQATDHHSKELNQAADQHKKEMTQASALHSEEMAEALRFHREAFRAAERHHDKSMRQERLLFEKGGRRERHLHMDSKKYDLKLFEWELMHAQQVSAKETIRDTYVQESQRAQALMIVVTLMLGCCFGVVVEGRMPDSAPESLVIAFSFTLVGSLGALIVSLGFAMNLQARITKYRIHDDVQYDPDGHRRRFARGFTEFFEKHCKHVYNSTAVALWVGTVLLLANAAVHVGARLSVTYQSTTAMSVFVLGVGASLLLLACVHNRYSVLDSTPANWDPEKDFNRFTQFVRNMTMELEGAEHLCPKCGVSWELYEHCRHDGSRHRERDRYTKCRQCRQYVTPDSMRFCPIDGQMHAEPRGGWRDGCPTPRVVLGSAARAASLSAFRGTSPEQFHREHSYPIRDEFTEQTPESDIRSPAALPPPLDLRSPAARSMASPAGSPTARQGPL
eukprot:TRINITY_DN3499_c0_g1_i1.p1 TRINITY_DN3499_c0_g1~~TRINITY_DN3499_c0_g1_i1.p1  ORF type:complete len:520 (+),score=145.03 TRINITY_DN3499_c0_g1_i1:1225-2784(+)